MSAVTNEQLMSTIQSLALNFSKLSDEIKAIANDVSEVKNRKSKSSTKASPPITIDALASTNGLAAGSAPAAGAAAVASNKKMAINLFFLVPANYAKYEPSFPATVKTKMAEVKDDPKKSADDQAKARRQHAYKFLKEDASPEGVALLKKITDDRDAAHTAAPAATPAPAPAAAAPVAAAAAPNVALSADDLSKLLAGS